MPAPHHRLALKRVYAPASPGDGRRVLVERLWPRGLRKEEAGVDLWLKEVAPSHALRRWFHEAPEARWPGFRDRYREELRGGAAAAPLAELRGLARAWARDPAVRGPRRGAQQRGGAEGRARGGAGMRLPDEEGPNVEPVEGSSPFRLVHAP